MGVGGWPQQTPGRSLTEQKKVFRNQFSQKGPQALHVLNHGWWRLAVGSWQLAVGGGWWRLVVGDWWLVAAVSGWQLAVGRRWRLAAVGGWRLVAVGGWQLAVDGSWRLAVGGPLGRSLRAVLSKEKKIWSLKDRPGKPPPSWGPLNRARKQKFCIMLPSQGTYVGDRGGPKVSAKLQYPGPRGPSGGGAGVRGLAELGSPCIIAAGTGGQPCTITPYNQENKPAPHAHCGRQCLGSDGQHTLGSGKMVCAGEGPFEPRFHPPRAQTSGSLKGSGRGSERGSGGTPTNIPQNDPHDVLIILRYVSMGKRIFRSFSVRAALRPDFRAIFKSMDCLYTRALMFEPLFQTPPPPLLLSANLFAPP